MSEPIEYFSDDESTIVGGDDSDDENENEGQGQGSEDAGSDKGDLEEKEGELVEEPAEEPVEPEGKEAEEDWEDSEYGDSESDDDDYAQVRLRKLTKELTSGVMKNMHTELQYRSNEEIEMLVNVLRDHNGRIVDPLHRTVPILSKYERARILGERAKQLEEGAQPFIQVKPGIIDSYAIAELELKAKAVPFILERPMPSGGCEYWRLADLEFI